MGVFDGLPHWRSPNEKTSLARNKQRKSEVSFLRLAVWSQGIFTGCRHVPIKIGTKRAVCEAFITVPLAKTPIIKFIYHPDTEVNVQVGDPLDSLWQLLSFYVQLQ